MLVLVGFAVVYLKKVVEPHVLRLDALAVARATSSLGGTVGQRRAAAFQPRGHEAGPTPISRTTSSGGRSL